MNATNPDPASFAAPLDWALFAGAETLVQPPSDASLSLGSRLRRDERK